MLRVQYSGIRRRLEEWVRDHAITNEEVYVVTDPVLTDGPYQEIEPNGVDVPKRYFKALLDYKEPEPKAIGSILPNGSSRLPPSVSSVPVDEVEQMTNLDFFYLFQVEIEEKLEAVGDIRMWN